jgi:hypothetical protein
VRHQRSKHLIDTAWRCARNEARRRMAREWGWRPRSLTAAAYRGSSDGSRHLPKTTGNPCVRRIVFAVLLIAACTLPTACLGIGVQSGAFPPNSPLLQPGFHTETPVPRSSSSATTVRISLRQEHPAAELM